MDSDTVYTRTAPEFPTNQHKYANVIRVRGRVRADGSRVTAELSRNSLDGVDVVRTITDETAPDAVLSTPSTTQAG